MCGKQNISRRTTVFVCTCSMNAHHLTNTHSYSLISIDVNLLELSDAIIVYRDKKKVKWHQNLVKLATAKNVKSTQVVLFNDPESNLEHDIYIFCYFSKRYAVYKS